MSHGFITNNGLRFAAFAGDESSTWHRLGKYNMAGRPLAEWREESGLDFEAVKVPAFAKLPDGTMVPVDNAYHIARGDNWDMLSGNTVTERYELHQVSVLQDQLQEYIDADSRFRWDSMISIDGGKTIAMSALFSEDVIAGGDKHKARLLATTAFDSTQASILRGHMEAVVCRNTLRAALGEAGGMIRVRHNTKYNRDRIARDLEKLVASFDAYKAMADAMAGVRFGADKVSQLFKAVLDIPFDAKREDVSTRKMNQFSDLSRAYRTTVAEGREKDTAWAALNAVTRYVDHDRGTRGGDNEIVARYSSSQFGSGAAMKEKAVGLLYDMTDGELLKAAIANTENAKRVSGGVDVAALLRAPLVTRAN